MMISPCPQASLAGEDPDILQAAAIDGLTVLSRPRVIERRLALLDLRLEYVAVQSHSPTASMPPGASNKSTASASTRRRRQEGC
jgi:hypothetical protein